MTPVTRSRTVKPTFIEFRRKKHVKPLKPPPRPPGIPSGRERMRKLLEALEGPTPPFERRETREERLRACYYLIVNMINVKQSVGSMFPIFRLGFWSHRQARKSRCCGHRVAKGMTHIAVVEENNHVRWVVHYDCFKRFIDIKHPRFANRLAIKHNDEELQDILRNDFEPGLSRPGGDVAGFYSTNASPIETDSAIDLSGPEGNSGDSHAPAISNETMTATRPSAEQNGIAIVVDSPRTKSSKPGPFRKVRARATSIGKRVYSMGWAQPPPHIVDTTESQEKKATSTFISSLWSKFQNLRRRRAKADKKAKTPSGPIILVDNETATPENPENHESDDESDGNFSAIEIFDQEYSEEGSDQKGFRMVRYIPRHERGPSEDTSTNTASELIYVPYTPESERNDRSNKRSKKSN
ncbi:Mitochondrial presequence protease [Ascosphaera pollenicola]|nr:Mitochondrial presequence protease [Ascosphaera pollenicola]